MSREPERYGINPEIHTENVHLYGSKSSELAVLLLTLNRKLGGGQHPSRAEMVRAMGLSKRAVDEAVRRLVKTGALIPTLL